MVGASGFEPPASWSRTRRSTRLSHAPINKQFNRLHPPAQATTISFVNETGKLRDLPAVHEVIDRLAPALGRFPHSVVLAETRRVLGQMRTEIRDSAANGLAAEIRVERALLALEEPSIRRVINATG